MTRGPECYLSAHFTLGEMLRTAHRSIDNTPSIEIVERLEVLCRLFLEPIRTKFGPLLVTSGYRSAALNSAIGGAWNSAHMYGCAADFVALDPAVTVTDVVRWIKNESGLDFDQVIDEGSNRAAWCHLGLIRPGHELEPRRQALTMREGKYSGFTG